MIMEYNETSEQRVHKYTINLPKGLMQKANEKAVRLGILKGGAAIIIRTILVRELNKDNFLSLEELSSSRVESQEKFPAPYRREKLYKKDGFIKLGIKRISDIINPRQQFFEFKK